ncbi:14039_t:CDS:10 [Funneliformis geosporum]|uniref:14039_t:CDS:1 n=1 Tax=Funneliformis geosporum TaxID=1117311 RepID=A0A9W4SAE9_9GLOM|nr:14039_t:CDS:10 [Funneliformis geosporum]
MLLYEDFYTLLDNLDLLEGMMNGEKTWSTYLPLLYHINQIIEQIIYDISKRAGNNLVVGISKTQFEDSVRSNWAQIFNILKGFDIIETDLVAGSFSSSSRGHASGPIKQLFAKLKRHRFKYPQRYYALKTAYFTRNNVVTHRTLVRNYLVLKRWVTYENNDAKAKMDYHSKHPMDLCFNAGEIIKVLGIENEDWWNGSIPNTERTGGCKFGSFPKIFVEVVESDSDYQQQKITISSIRNNININSKPSLPPRKQSTIISYDNSSISKNNKKSDIFSKLPEILNKLPELSQSNSYSTNNSSRESVTERSVTPTFIDHNNYNDESYEKFEELTNPVSLCEPVITDDFEGFFDASVVDFSIIDEYARETPELETKTIKRLSHYLTSVWDHPLYKLRAIFVWVTDNISYDCESFYSGRRTANGAKDVLKSRMAVCAGYSELFYELSNAAGINVMKVNGFAKGAGYQVGDDVSSYGHAWNAILYEGEYLLIDSTWGAGHVNNKQFNKLFNPFYFMCSPMKMIYNHLPTNPKQQYLQPTISSEEFLNLPFIKPQYFENEINFTKWPGCIAETSKDKISLEFEQAMVEKNVGHYSAKLDWKGQSILAVVQRLTRLSPNGGILYRILCNIPSKGDGNLSLFYFPHGSNQGSAVTTLKVVNYGTGTNYKPFVLIYNQLSLTIMTPLEQTLEYNTKVRFEVNVFGENPTPKLLVYEQSFKTKKYLKIIDKNDDQDYVTFVGDVVINEKGNWNLAYESSKNYYSYIATYEV